MAIKSAAEVALPKPTPAHCRVAHAWVSDHVYRLLEVEAERRRWHVDRVVAELVSTIALTEGALEAILER